MMAMAHSTTVCLTRHTRGHMAQRGSNGFHQGFKWCRHTRGGCTLEEPHTGELLEGDS